MVKIGFFFSVPFGEFWFMDSFLFLFPAWFYFGWKLSDPVHLFLCYFFAMHHRYPFDNPGVGYCLQIPSRNVHTYLIMYFFPFLQGKIKVINVSSARKQSSVLRRGVGLLLWMKCGTGKRWRSGGNGCGSEKHLQSKHWTSDRCDHQGEVTILLVTMILGGLYRFPKSYHRNSICMQKLSAGAAPSELLAVGFGWPGRALEKLFVQIRVVPLLLWVNQSKSA